MKEIAQYINGNTTVVILDDGTKIREYDGAPRIEHPESIDVKITDYCDMGCPYCHENSTTRGAHADIDELLCTLSTLPPGVELAIGGGNPLAHPHLIDFLERIKERGLIANITVNQGHIPVYRKLLERLILEKLVNGIGVSITSMSVSDISWIWNTSDNVVCHLIAGVNSVSIINRLVYEGADKILILGYKVFGRGESYWGEDVAAGLARWRDNLHKYIRKCTIAFDNLAIEQLSVRRLFTQEGWNEFYMGDDFCFTMYIDAVRREYAPTSRSKSRTSFDNSSLLEYFHTRPR